MYYGLIHQCFARDGFVLAEKMYTVNTVAADSIPIPIFKMAKVVSASLATMVAEELGLTVWERLVIS